MFRTVLRVFIYVFRRSSGGEVEMYTGTMIADLLSLVERAQEVGQKVIQRKTAESQSKKKKQTSEPEKLPQPLGLGAADRDLGLLFVIHPKLVRTLEPGHNLADPVDVHQIRTMRAPE